ncbi:MAG: hypothetical protein HY615_15735 [Candidatus Rokubacteria bacterium]|nr:hypothetical protein [Candidatus Rokubacteria bacterium]
MNMLRALASMRATTSTIAGTLLGYFFGGPMSEVVRLLVGLVGLFVLGYIALSEYRRFQRESDRREKLRWIRRGILSQLRLADGLSQELGEAINRNDEPAFAGALARLRLWRDSTADYLRSQLPDSGADHAFLAADGLRFPNGGSITYNTTWLEGLRRNLVALLASVDSFIVTSSSFDKHFKSVSEPLRLETVDSEPAQDA